ELSVRPDVVLIGSDIEIADENRLPVGLGAAQPGFHLVNEGELVGEFLVDRRVRLVAAGGYVEIMDEDVAVAVADEGGGVARVALAAEAAKIRTDKGQARDGGDAVIALLAVDQDVPIAAIDESRLREL